LLLALPGVCATLALAPLIIPVLFSAQFGPASEILRWQVLGVFLRVASWPLGYLLLAKGKARLYFWTEASYNLVHAALIWICVQVWGLPGAGVAFFGLYVYYWVLMSIVARRLSGFAWSKSNRRIAAIAIPAVAFVFLCPALMPSPWDAIAAAAATMLAGLYALRALLALPADVNPDGVSTDRMERLRAARLRVAGFLQVNHG
jgi:PST family polysaccharide transporter